MSHGHKFDGGNRKSRGNKVVRARVMEVGEYGKVLS